MTNFIVFKKKHFLKSTKALLFVYIAMSLLSACGSDKGGGQNEWDSTPPTIIRGAAVKGPLIDALVSVFSVNLNSSDLKGVLVASGITDENAAISDLMLTASQLGQGPFIIEFTDGRERTDYSIPVIPALSTFANKQQLAAGMPIYATPLSTLVLEIAARQIPYLLTADDAGNSSSALLSKALNHAQEQVKASFGLGLLDEDIDLFTHAPILVASVDKQQALAYRLASEVFAALINDVREQAVSHGAVGSGNDFLRALADDIFDGAIDGYAGGNTGLKGEPIDRLSSIKTTLHDIFQQDPMALMVPGGEGRNMAQLVDMLLEESHVLAPTLDRVDLSFPPLDDVQLAVSLEGNIPRNKQPTANAGVSRIIVLNESLTLNGLASSDPDEGNTLSYHWHVYAPDGTGFTLEGGGPQFIPNQEGDYRVSLTVNDGIEDSDAVQVIYKVVDTDNQAPLPDVLANLEAPIGRPILLRGSATDPEGNPANYQWTLDRRPEGSTASIRDANGVIEDLERSTATLASFIPDIAGTYIATLTVTDQPGQGIIALSGSASQTVTVAYPEVTELSVSNDVDGNGDIHPDASIVGTTAVTVSPFHNLLGITMGNQAGGLRVTTFSFSLDKPIDLQFTAFSGGGSCVVPSGVSHCVSNYMDYAASLPGSVAAGPGSPGIYKGFESYAINLLGPDLIMDTGDGEPTPSAAWPFISLGQRTMTFSLNGAAINDGQRVSLPAGLYHFVATSSNANTSVLGVLRLMPSQ